MAYSTRRDSIGLDGAESRYCDLSSRRLTSGQIDRTLRVFATADTIDLSNNEIDKIPASIPAEVMTLDISFNIIASIQGIERLKFVQELHLAYNRLDDVSLLEYCPCLVHVNLSGNRLMNTKGLETLEFLENLDISDNLIEFSEALRALSLNYNLTHLTIRGNPLSQKPGYHVPMLDMIPSLIMLDDKKMRSTIKYKTKEVTATKSLSYSRIYDDKKQFVIHKQTRPRPATTVQPLLPGDSVSKYNGSMFLPPPIEPTHERARAGIQKYHDTAQMSPPPVPFSPSMSKAPHSPSKYRAAPYLSMYDRLAQTNGISEKRPISPTVKPIVDLNPKPNRPGDAATTRLGSENQHTANRHKSVVKSSNGGNRVSTLRHSIASRDSQQRPQRSNSLPRRSSSVRFETPTDAGQNLGDRQKNVMSVIQNLIDHKRQSLATLGAQKVASTAGTPTRSCEYSRAGQIVL